MTQTMSKAQELKARYAEAMKLLKDNRLPAALALFGTIHDEKPDIPEVEYQISRLFARYDRFDRALMHGKLAVQLAPKQVAVWQALAETVALEGSPQERRDFLKSLKAAPIADADKQPLMLRFGALSKQTKPQTGGAPGSVLQEMLAKARAGRHAEVLALSGKAMKAYPRCAQAANLAGVALSAQGRTSEALAALKTAVAIDPGYAEAHANMALVLFRMEKFDEAVAAFRAAIIHAPDMVDALFGLGQLMLAREMPVLAEHWLKRAYALEPDRQDILRAIGSTYTTLRQYAQAVQIYRKLARLTARKDVGCLLMLAQAESHMGDEGTAEKLFEEALRLKPGSLTVLSAKASHMQRLARFDEAREAFLTAIAADPSNGDMYRLYYTSQKATPDDPLVGEMEKRFEDPALDDRQRMAFGYALAKVHEDLKNNDRVFDYLDPANALMRKLHPYDHSAQEKRMDELFDKMDGLDWHNFQAPDPTDFDPIFVTGMPRSGTTLVEQIISSHSRVTGGGEIGDNSVSAMRLIVPNAGSAMRAATTIPPEEFSRLGHAYAAMVKERFPEADRITDKSIQTYVTMGLMKLAMPNARFIVVRRDPRDNLLSIYKNVFAAGTHLYACDQVDVARQYNLFVRAVDYWRARVPGWFHEVQYEDLVADPEPQSRALIAACGLDWEDACLNFHQNTRKVETLSVWQVRQPISKSSVRAWERYGDRLKPMLDQLRADGHIKD